MRSVAILVSEREPGEWRPGDPPEVVRAILSTDAERLARADAAAAWRGRHPGARMPARCARQLAADAAVALWEAGVAEIEDHLPARLFAHPPR